MLRNYLILSEAKLVWVCLAYILAILRTCKEKLSTAQPVLTKRPLALGNSWC